MFLEATTCTATSGLGHASSKKPWRTCERQVQDARPTTRTHSSSPRACAEQDLTLHLLDVVPESDIQKAREVHGQQDLKRNAVRACRLESWRSRGGTIGSRSARLFPASSAPLVGLLLACYLRDTRNLNLKVMPLCQLCKTSLAVASSMFILETPCKRKQTVSIHCLADLMYHRGSYTV